MDGPEAKEKHLKTHCKNGHEYKAGSFIMRDKKIQGRTFTSRRCLICNRLQNKIWWRSKYGDARLRQLQRSAFALRVAILNLAGQKIDVDMQIFDNLIVCYRKLGQFLSK